MTDARFEDGAEQPLRLRAETAEDLAVISALVQDAVAEVKDAAWTPKRRRFAVLLTRFRWEDAEAARRQGRPYERVRSLLTIENGLTARASGLDPRDGEQIVSLLALGWTPGEDGTGVLTLTLAGDGEVAIGAEALEVTLTDVTRPHLAVAKTAPTHPEG
jgi:hypothetical protein